MPLIIITGLPCSGKTHRAQQLVEALQAHIACDDDAASSRRTVQLIASQHASADVALTSTSTETRPSNLRDEIYNSAAQEKTARAAEFSAIKRALSRDNVVVADGLNYIKGYRYQLWCEAKAAATRCCVVHVAALEDDCRRWNRERLRAWGRAEEADEAGTSAAKQAPGAQGTNVLGDLAPESHTAIYGDRVVGEETTGLRSRSRSSSVGAVDSDEDVSRRARGDDRMTLKSLYISDEQKTVSPEEQPRPQLPQTAEDPTPTASPSTTLPPPPTAAPPYSPSTLTSLSMRYEPPSPFSRWDTPLFTIPSSDASPPTAQIWAALFPAPTKPTSKKALAQQQRSLDTSANSANGGSVGTQRDVVKQHAATVLPKATTADALQVLESATMDVVKQLLAQARASGLAVSGEGGDLTFSIPIPIIADPGSGGGAPQDEASVVATIHVPPATLLSQPLLQRLRRKYTQVQRGGIAHGQGYVSGRRAVIEGFIGFLDAEWNGSEE